MGNAFDMSSFYFVVGILFEVALTKFKSPSPRPKSRTSQAKPCQALIQISSTPKFKEGIPIPSPGGQQ